MSETSYIIKYIQTIISPTKFLIQKIYKHALSILKNLTKAGHRITSVCLRFKSLSNNLISNHQKRHCHDI